VQVGAAAASRPARVTPSTASRRAATTFSEPVPQRKDLQFMLISESPGGRERRGLSRKAVTD